MEADIEIILERAKELHPEARPRIILDNGPQFIAKDFKEFVRISGMTHVRTPPYYPQWQVADGYAATRYRLEQRDGVAVYRCPLWVPGRVSGLKRLVHLASFAASSLPAMIRQAFWRPDVVWMAAPAGTEAGRLGLIWRGEEGYLVAARAARWAVEPAVDPG